MLGLFYDLVNYGAAAADSHSNEQLVLFKLGVCIKVNTEIIFSSPLVQLFYQKNYVHIIMSKVEIPKYKFPGNIKQFLTDAICYFDPEVLENSLSRRKEGFVYEIAYNQEFYRVAYLLYFRTIGGSISGNVGSYFQVRGAIDLYLNNNTQFGFEFLIRSRRIEEHIQRFSERYVNIPFKQFAIIDFYDCVDEEDVTLEASKKSQFYNNPNYYRVFFFDSFTKFALKHQEEITLHVLSNNN